MNQQSASKWGGRFRPWKQEAVAECNKRHSASGEAVVALMGREGVVGKWASRLAVTKERGEEGGWWQIEPARGVASARGSKAKSSTTMARDSTAGRGSTAMGGTTRVGTTTQGASWHNNDSKGRHENEGRIDEGQKVLHDGSTEGKMRRRIALTKGGMMTARGDTARGGTVRAAQQRAAQRKAVW